MAGWLRYANVRSGAPRKAPAHRAGIGWPAKCAFWVLCCAFGVPFASHAADGVYFGAELGASVPGGFALTRTNHGVPTNCDQWLGGHDFDGDGVDDVPLPPGECAPRALPAGANEVDLDAGLLAAASVGVMRGRLRIEAEYVHRRQSGGTASLVVPGDPKQREFVRREEGADDVRVDSLFANLYWMFPPTAGGKWTPYVGVGVGAMRVSFDYAATSVRTGDAAALIALGRNPNAAGTTSRALAGLSDTLVGGQVLAGVRYRLGEDRSVNLKLRYADALGEFSAGGNRWRTLRDHASTVAPGGAPVRYDIDADGLRSWGVSVGFEWRLR